ncbi:MAG: hypothetical protein GY845_36310 [Planctomycetes bacterium]|nr:hypothetical protein [Planctomycetota bacterium]
MTNAIQIILLLLGSILMLVTGLGFSSSKYAFFIGVVCLMVSVFTEGKIRKIIGIEGNQRWKSLKNTEHK